MKKTIIFIVLSTLLLISCKKKITQDQAVKIAIDFVNERVKFTTEVEDEKIIVNRANNTIKNVYQDNNVWFVDIYVESTVEEETKKAYFIVEIDATTGKVKDLQQVPLSSMK